MVGEYRSGNEKDEFILARFKCLTELVGLLFAASPFVFTMKQSSSRSEGSTTPKLHFPSFPLDALEGVFLVLED